MALYNILRGCSTNNFVGVWADKDASLINGKFYVVGKGCFNIVEITNKSIYDYYTTTCSGRAQESLNYVEITDINTTQGA